MQDNNKIVELISKYLNNELDEAGLRELEDWKAGEEENQKLFDRVTSNELFENIKERNRLDKQIFSQIEKKFELSEEETSGGKVKRMYWRWLLVACVVFLVVLGSYLTFYSGEADKQEVVHAHEQSSEIEPGSYKAKLALSDGTIVVLDNTTSGELATQGNVKVKNQNGQLIYAVDGNNTEVLYNTLTTSIGESYSTVLADGSRIWLNSASCVKFPVAFVGNERVIVASGEVYLEVTKDSRPFKVEVMQESRKKCEVQVLGTSFNVMAYSDEDKIETTLLEGKIIFTDDNVRKILRPGQQASLNKKGAVRVLNDVNTDKITAWKSQDFYFKSDNLRTIMRQLARWYGIQIEFDGKITEVEFSGQISRNKNLSEVLRMIEQSGIRFKIMGKKVVIESE